MSERRDGDMPRKRVLVVTYSQSGQLRAIVEHIIAPLRDHDDTAAIDVHVETLRSQREFPFPWPVLTFIDTFPECAHLDPAPLAPMRAMDLLMV